MKKYAYSSLLVVISILFITPLQGQPKEFTGEAYLTTQAQVDAFDYTEVSPCGDPDFAPTPCSWGDDGRVVISGNDITNVDSLYRLKDVTRLFIQNNPLLTNLDGLRNLRKVSAEFYITGNASLTSIEGLAPYFALSQGRIGEISGNPLLSVCCDVYPSLFRGNYVYITQNGPGCDSAEQVLADGPCPGYCPGDVTLNSQAAVDAFSCTIIDGKLIISGSDITNLDGLAGLKTVSGLVEIHDNPLLTNMNGLSTLSEVDGGIDIYNNAILPNLDGLDNLLLLEGDLQIANNPSLTQIDALSSIIWIEGELNMLDNPVLANLHGLSSLTFVKYRTTITRNASLVDLQGLNALREIGRSGWLEIAGNKSLETLDGLSSLQRIGQYFEIINNPALKNLNGLSGLRSVENGFLEITNNPSLTNLGGLSSFKYIGNELRIHENDALLTLDGLGQLEFVREISIKDNDALISIELAAFEENSLDKLEIINNDALTSIDAFGTLTSVTGDVTITDNDVLDDCCLIFHLVCQDRPDCTNDRVDGTLTIANNDGGCTVAKVIEDGPCGMECFGTYRDPLVLSSQAEVDVFNCWKVTGKFQISGSDITNLDGLSVLREHGWSSDGFDIVDNPNLTSIKGLSNMTQLGPWLSIQRNDKLENLDGFPTSATEGSMIGIGRNPMLSNIDGLYGTTELWSLALFESPLLTNLDALSTLTKIGDDGMYIADNPILTSFCGLYPLLSGPDAPPSYYIYLRQNGVNPTVADILAAGPCAPRAPSDLTADINYALLVPLTWKDNSFAEDGFRVIKDGAMVKELPPNTESWTDTCITFGVPVSYQVVAFSAAGESPPSNTATYSMPATIGRLDLTYSCYNPATGKLMWNVNNPNAQQIPYIYAQWWSPQRDTLFAMPGNSQFMTDNNPQNAGTWGNDNITGIWWVDENPRPGEPFDLVMTAPLGNTCGTARLTAAPMAPKAGKVFTGQLARHIDFGAMGPEAIEQSFKIIPNPFEDIIRIESNGVETGGKIRILTPMGRERYRRGVDLRETQVLNLSFLASGLYILEIRTENQVFTEKIVKR